MSGKYFWNNTDLANITGITSGTDYLNASGTVIFKSLPGVKKTFLSGYQTYTSDDISEPPFYDNGISIFRNIVVQSTTVSSGNGNISKPAWANACKIYVASQKGANGTKANGIAAKFENSDENNNTNTNYNNNENNNDTNHNNNGWGTNQNIRRNHHSNYEADTGKAAKTGGSGYIIHTSKAITLTADDTIAYDINGTYNNLEINRGGTTRARVRVYDGTDATNGTDADTSSTTENIVVAAPDNAGTGDPENKLGGMNYTAKALNYDAMREDFKPYLQRDWNHNTTNLIASVSGADGSDGYEDTNSSIEFNNYVIGTSYTPQPSPLINVYWFKV